MLRLFYQEKSYKKMTNLALTLTPNPNPKP